MVYPNRIIKKGETNSNIVKAIQQQLVKHGITNVLQNGIFDNSLVSGVKLFQSRNTDHHGNPLIADGIIGPITWEILFSEPIPVDTSTTPFLQKVLDKANLQIGIMEQPMGSNRGTEVEKYLKSVGLNGGYPWCMAFVYWCFDEICTSEGKSNPLVKTGGVLHQWNNTVLPKIMINDAVNNPGIIKPGHIFIINHGNGRGHTGIVESVQGGFLNTIEGNTNLGQSREGIGVYRLRTRKINSITKGFINTSL